MRFFSKKTKSKKSETSDSPESFFSFETLQSTDFYVQSIELRAQRKRESGQRLSTVEAHILKKHSSSFFGPSPISAICQAFRVAAKPAPIMLVIGLILAAEVNTAALLDRSIRSLRGPQTAVTLQKELEELSVEEVKSSDSSDEKEPREIKSEGLFAELLKSAAFSAARVTRVARITESMVKVQESSVEELRAQRGLIEFISGVIAVYYPKEANSGAIARHIVEVSNEEQVDPLYVASLIAVESSFKKHVRSHVGATGLMQVMPRTAKYVAKRRDGTRGAIQLTDPRTNIRLGITYLKELEAQYKGDKNLALAAYNWGPGNIAKIKRNPNRIPKSVKNYAKKILNKTSAWQVRFSDASKHAAELEEQAKLIIDAPSGKA
jgi:soluble lytic murein transglycosylase-like protein